MSKKDRLFMDSYYETQGNIFVLGRKSIHRIDLNKHETEVVCEGYSKYVKKEDDTDSDEVFQSASEEE